ncbi:hypothetical protein A8D95_37915 [Burkholderia cenocepacia]|nr:hypothetical protein A8D84_21255 [Burkholderia cenocepacia]ONP31757.1 hypothetical protein A8D86_30240 [Burkholderia cenocepacia]ONP58251.1 hypothetical protein A8D89_17995 [Burkholderia cenocepacia]ONP64586.1 hypothetical protein A8D88_20325 [Burkholderia cenocepacia]ONP72840.1 hypothetical protein A8D94_17320 [Burkholderia cenocepacia]
MVLATPVPLLASDVEGSVLLEAAEILKSVPAFADSDAAIRRQAVATALGYARFSDMHVAKDPSSDRGLGLRRALQMDAMAWRIFKAGLAGIADSELAIKLLWPYSGLSLWHRYSGFTLVSERTIAPYEWPEHFRTGNLKIPPYKCALDGQERLFLSERVESALDIVNQFWTPDDGLERDAVIAELEATGWLDLRLAIRSYGDEAAPPGCAFKSYFDTNGTLLGHGVFVREVQAYLSDIYPPDGSEFVEAVVALWQRQPAPRCATKLPTFVFADEFVNPWLPAEPRDKRFFEQQERDGLRTDGEHIALGRLFEHEGSAYTAPGSEWTVGQFEGVLGLHLVSEKEVPADLLQWLSPKVPYGLSSDTFRTLRTVAHTIEELGEKEQLWLKSQENNGAISFIAELAAEHGRALRSGGVEVTLESTSGMAEWDIELGASRARDLYPELLALSDDILGDMCVDFYLKNGVRHDGQPEQWSPTFLAFATLRCLGVDVFRHFSRYDRDWFGVYALVREQMGKFSATTRREQIQLLIAQLREFAIELGHLLRLPEELDNSLEASRMEPRARDERWVENGSRVRSEDGAPCRGF